MIVFTDRTLLCARLPWKGFYKSMVKMMGDASNLKF